MPVVNGKWVRSPLVGRWTVYFVDDGKDSWSGLFKTREEAEKHKNEMIANSKAWGYYPERRHSHCVGKKTVREKS